MSESIILGNMMRDVYIFLSLPKPLKTNVSFISALNLKIKKPVLYLTTVRQRLKSF